MPFSTLPSLTFPYISELLRISGKINEDILKALSRKGSHCSVSMFIRNVLDAFVTSVMCKPPLTPPVKCCKEYYNVNNTVYTSWPLTDEPVVTLFVHMYFVNNFAFKPL